MTFRHTLLTLASTLLIAALAMFPSGCSKSDSPNGPEAASTPVDQVSVSLDRLSVKYDCDYDPVGVTQPGDFWYSLNVDTLSDDGHWVAVSKNKERNSEVSNGKSVGITGEAATFSLPRIEGQAFRVRLTLREADSGGDDFKSSHTVEHDYLSSNPQMYPPKGANYSSYKKETRTGTMTWNVNKRDRSWVAGILTKEGCNATLSYTVISRQLN